MSAFVNKLVKATAFLLIIAIVAEITACSDSGEKESPAAVTTASDSVRGDSDNSTTETSILDTLPEADFGGRTFRTITQTEIWWELTLLTTEEMNGEVINDSVYERNAAFEAKYNAVFVSDNMTSSPYNTARNTLLAGDSNYDFLTLNANDSYKLAQESLVCNLNNIGTIDFTNDAWDSNACGDYSILDKLYIGVSDFSLSKSECIWVYMFNKRMLEDYNLESPYNLVRDGEWTFEKSYEMMEAVATDKNGDGVMGAGDIYGLATHNVNYYALLIAGDSPLAIKDADDQPAFNLDDRFNEVYDKITQLFGNSESTVFEYQGETFIAGEALLCGQVLACVRLYRTMDDDFGVIPVPKYTAEQENYCSYVIPYDVYSMSVPVTCSDIDDTGTVMQAMAILSNEYLVSAYYDVTLTGKGLRDEESVDMLDLILDTTVYDIARMYDFGGFPSGIVASLQNQLPITSSYEKRVKMINKSIDKLVVAISENEY